MYLYEEQDATHEIAQTFRYLAEPQEIAKERACAIAQAVNRHDNLIRAVTCVLNCIEGHEEIKHPFEDYEPESLRQLQDMVRDIRAGADDLEDMSGNVSQASRTNDNKRTIRELTEALEAAVQRLVSLDRQLLAELGIKFENDLGEMIRGRAALAKAKGEQHA